MDARSLRRPTEDGRTAVTVASERARRQIGIIFPPKPIAHRSSNRPPPSPLALPKCTFLAEVTETRYNIQKSTEKKILRGKGRSQDFMLLGELALILPTIIQHENGWVSILLIVSALTSKKYTTGQPPRRTSQSVRPSVRLSARLPSSIL